MNTVGTYAMASWGMTRGWRGMRSERMEVEKSIQGISSNAFVGLSSSKLKFDGPPIKGARREKTGRKWEERCHLEGLITIQTPRSKTMVASHCSVVMIWLADIWAAMTCHSGDGEGSGEGETPRYIRSKLDAFPWPSSLLRHSIKG